MYKTLGAKWLYETPCPALAFVTADRDEARNPQRFIHAAVGPLLPHEPTVGSSTKLVLSRGSVEEEKK